MNPPLNPPYYSIFQWSSWHAPVFRKKPVAHFDLAVDFSKHCSGWMNLYVFDVGGIGYVGELIAPTKGMGGIVVQRRYGHSPDEIFHAFYKMNPGHKLRYRFEPELRLVIAQT